MIAAAEELVNDAHAEAVQSFLDANGLRPGHLAAVGFHGQTLLHRPERGLTMQIGSGRVLAERLGIPIVYDFRAADVAAGGQGAPLAPIFHQALVRRLGPRPPVAVLNVGGVANVTFIDGDTIDRLRYRARQRIARRLPAGADRKAARHRRPSSRGGDGGRAK